jgi:hypothetical protein
MNPLIKMYGKEKRWVNWQLQERKGKQTKVPYHQVKGVRKMASSTDPETWTTYDKASAQDPRVGIVFTPSQRLLGIDIDHCIAKGKLEHLHDDMIAKLLAEADTYTEISPSKIGLHLYFALTAPLKLEANRHGSFECYTAGRYFTVTEEPFGKEKAVRTITPKEAQALLALIGYPWKGKPPTTTKKVKSSSSSSSKSSSSFSILDKMFAAANGVGIKKLYDGDISAYADDKSRADAALLSHLAFWTAKDADEMEKLWLASTLGQRKKTQEREDYRKRSIAKAVANCTTVYEPDLHFGESEMGIEDLGLLYTLKDKRKIYFKNTENIARVLNKHPDFAGMLRFDAYHNIIQRKVRGQWRNLEDRDSIDLQTKISVLFSDFANVSKEMVYDAMIKVAYDNKIDSGIDYLNSLIWDEMPRIEQWLTLAYHTPEDEYHKKVGANWLKGMVKRIIDPGCKFDYVLVLEGKQGIRKSTSLATLAGNLGHAETTISTEQKDFFLLMQGNAIIEFSEGETLSRTEVKQLKAVITTAVDKFRQPYGRAVVPHPRRCVFAMTTNQTEYLKDETGNRRWLPVTVTGNADLKWLAENREQLLAEAYFKVRHGETTWEFPEDDLEEQQIARRVKDPNIDVIVNWYWSQPPSVREAGFTIAEVYMGALHGGFMTKPMTRNEEVSISDVLRTWLRLESRKAIINGIRSNRFYPTEKTLDVVPEQMPSPAGIVF